METITSWHTLLRYAKELAEARKSGDEELIKIANDEELIKIAKNRHDEYAKICLNSDKLLLHYTKGNLT